MLEFAKAALMDEHAKRRVSESLKPTPKRYFFVFKTTVENFRALRMILNYGRDAFGRIISGCRLDKEVNAFRGFKHNMPIVLTV